MPMSNRRNNSSSNNGGSGSGGITQTIRSHLNFQDDRKWKEFSNRRLELIDHFKLSDKKASEQDDLIKNIANILRIEFNYPLENLSDFDKLVRAAVQSVRRNRKRSSKSRLKNDRFVSMNEKSDLMLKQNFTEMASNKVGLNTVIMSTPPTAPLPTLSVSNNKDQILGQQEQQQPQNSPTENQQPSKTPPPVTVVASTAKFQISDSVTKKILNFIDKSKTCLRLSNNDPQIHEDNLLILGQSSIMSSISFVLERFFNDLPSNSIMYLLEKLQSVDTISKILKSIGFQLKDVMILNDTLASNLFYKLVGSCIKDFGFDQLVYIIGEIFHEIILKEYPLISTQISKLTIESLIAPTLSIIPSNADQEFNKKVVLKYNDKFFNFTYSPISSAPPTFMEILSNGKSAFELNTIGKQLRLKTKDREIVNDEELESLFNSNSNEIELELYYFEEKAVSPAPSNSVPRKKPMMEFTPLL